MLRRSFFAALLAPFVERFLPGGRAHYTTIATIKVTNPDGSQSIIGPYELDASVADGWRVTCQLS